MNADETQMGGARMGRTFARKLLVVALPAVVLASLVAVTLVEIWVRSQWDARRGTPGFFLSDPALGLRLAPGYDGWFAGTPVRINSLGFRDPREYPLDKSARTFRVVVLGDSVTFGHGALFETTYPRLLEERLKAWRPDVDWQVWNLGVPGLNTSQELAYLHEVGDRYQPDLVVVGFYVNDFTNNEALTPPATLRRVTSALQRTMQRHLYSYELYKRVYLTARWRLRRDEGDLKRLEHLATEGTLLAQSPDMAARPEQQLTPVDRFSDAEVDAFVCIGVPPADSRGADDLRALAAKPASDLSPWLAAVHGFQQLQADRRFPVVFFVNMAPEICPGADRFYDAGALAFSDAIAGILGGGTVPVVSTARAFLHYRPSQMPAAQDHSLGNANRVKADVLFDLLKTQVLPPMVPPQESER